MHACTHPIHRSRRNNGNRYFLHDTRPCLLYLSPRRQVISPGVAFHEWGLMVGEYPPRCPLAPQLRDKLGHPKTLWFTGDWVAPNLKGCLGRFCCRGTGSLAGSAWMPSERPTRKTIYPKSLGNGCVGPVTAGTVARAVGPAFDVNFVLLYHHNPTINLKFKTAELLSNCFSIILWYSI